MNLNDNNRSGEKQGKPSSEWRRFLGGLFGRRRMFRLPDQIEGEPRSSLRIKFSTRLMETLNGYNQEVVVRGQGEAFMGSSNSYRSTIRNCIILVSLLSIAGCSSLPQIKSNLITGAATTAVVGATSVLPGGVIVPSIAGGLTAASVSALSAPDQIKGEPVEVQAETFVQEAPDNFWTLLGKLVKVGGWALGLIILLPMLFSWLMPGPVQFKKKGK
mgnify:CR=1 FL=1